MRNKIHIVRITSFQFHLVRLKGGAHHRRPAREGKFQFHLVRLKGQAV